MLQINPTIKTVYDFCTKSDIFEQNTGLVDMTIKQFYSGDTFKWLELIPYVDSYIENNFKNRKINSSYYGTEDNMLTFLELASDTLCILYANAYEYNTLFDSMNFKYNPIENYNGVEEFESYEHNTGTITDVEGERKTTKTVNSAEKTTTTVNDSAEKKSTLTDVIGNSKTTNTSDYGKTKETTTTDAGEMTSTKSVSPSDEQTKFYAKDRDVTKQTEKGTTTTTGDAKKDIVVSENEEKTDTHTTIGEAFQDTITETETPYEDTELLLSDKKTDTNERDLETQFRHKLTKSGNMGVTTTQSMIMQERQIAYFSLIKIIAHDVVNNICTGIYYSF